MEIMLESAISMPWQTTCRRMLCGRACRYVIYICCARISCISTAICLLFGCLKYYTQLIHSGRCHLIYHQSNQQETLTVTAVNWALARTHPRVLHLDTGFVDAPAVARASVTLHRPELAVVRALRHVRANQTRTT